ncbi:Cyclic nucleotide-binding domain family protein [Leishmania donovani]|uniref:Cyclic nucleotide-binding domain family protein n=1 Tax=Leishmania donovani TaxID=5661 RepID=A0A504XZ44_LEIDO|nr:Cyclic nucleotide-binding domain family protein [Leishmania donovani]
MSAHDNGSNDSNIRTCISSVSSSGSMHHTAGDAAVTGVAPGCESMKHLDASAATRTAVPFPDTSAALTPDGSSSLARAVGSSTNQDMPSTTSAVPPQPSSRSQNSLLSSFRTSAPLAATPLPTSFAGGSVAYQHQSIAVADSIVRSSSALFSHEQAVALRSAKRDVSTSPPSRHIGGDSSRSATPLTVSTTASLDPRGENTPIQQNALEVLQRAVNHVRSNLQQSNVVKPSVASGTEDERTGHSIAQAVRAAVRAAEMIDQENVRSNRVMECIVAKGHAAQTEEELTWLYRHALLTSLLDTEDLQRIVPLSLHREYTHGELILDFGAPVQHLYVVVWGSVDVFRIDSVNNEQKAMEGAFRVASHQSVSMKLRSMSGSRDRHGSLSSYGLRLSDGQDASTNSDIPSDAVYTHVASLCPGQVFGIENCVFNTTSQYVFRAGSAMSKTVVSLLPYEELQPVLSGNPRFAQGVGVCITDSMDVFGPIREFCRYVFSPTSAQNEYLPLWSILESYTRIHNVIHTKLFSHEVDTGAWGYALNRLPDNLTSTFCFDLVHALPPFIASRMKVEARAADTRKTADGLARTRSMRTAITYIRTRERRRCTWHLGMEGKTLVLLRDGFTDLLDFLTMLCVHIIESNKLRGRMQGMVHPPAIDVLDEYLRQREQEELEGKYLAADGVTRDTEMQRVQTILKRMPLTEGEQAGLLRNWGHNTLLRLYEIMMHREEYNVRVDPSLSLKFQTNPFHEWALNLRSCVLEKLGLDRFSALPDDLCIDVISSNTHCIKNLLCSFNRKYRNEILDYVRLSESKRLGRPEEWHNMDDMLYAALTGFLQNERPDLKEEYNRSLEQSGITVLQDTAMTGLQVDVIPVHLLNFNTIDEAIRDAMHAHYVEATKSYNGEGESEASSSQVPTWSQVCKPIWRRSSEGSPIRVPGCMTTSGRKNISANAAAGAAPLDGDGDAGGELSPTGYDGSASANESLSTPRGAPMSHLGRNGRRQQHFLINMDFAFGAQAEGICRVIFSAFGKRIRSVSVMGKAGGLTGKRGDIQLASHVLLSKSSLILEDNQDELRNCRNQDLTAQRLQELAGPRVKVHHGKVLTVTGTMLQNVSLLRYYQQVWRCIGTEMEGSYFARVIEDFYRQGIAHPGLTTRFAYYTRRHRRGWSLSSWTVGQLLGSHCARTSHTFGRSFLSPFHKAPHPKPPDAANGMPLIVQRTYKLGVGSATDADAPASSTSPSVVPSAPEEHVTTRTCHRWSYVDASRHETCIVTLQAHYSLHVDVKGEGSTAATLSLQQAGGYPEGPSSDDGLCGFAWEFIWIPSPCPSSEAAGAAAAVTSSSGVINDEADLEAQQPARARFFFHRTTSLARSTLQGIGGVLFLSSRHVLVATETLDAAGAATGPAATSRGAPNDQLRDAAHYSLMDSFVLSSGDAAAARSASCACSWIRVAASASLPCPFASPQAPRHAGTTSAPPSRPSTVLLLVAGVPLRLPHHTSAAAAAAPLMRLVYVFALLGSSTGGGSSGNADPEHRAWDVMACVADLCSSGASADDPHSLQVRVRHAVTLPLLRLSVQKVSTEDGVHRGGGGTGWAHARDGAGGANRTQSTSSQQQQSLDPHDLLWAFVEDEDTRTVHPLRGGQLCGSLVALLPCCCAPARTLVAPPLPAAASSPVANSAPSPPAVLCMGFRGDTPYGVLGVSSAELDSYAKANQQRQQHPGRASHSSVQEIIEQLLPSPERAVYELAVGGLTKCICPAATVASRAAPMSMTALPAHTSLLMLIVDGIHTRGSRDSAAQQAGAARVVAAPAATLPQGLYLTETLSYDALAQLASSGRPEEAVEGQNSRVRVHHVPPTRTLWRGLDPLVLSVPSVPTSAAGIMDGEWGDEDSTTQGMAQAAHRDVLAWDIADVGRWMEWLSETAGGSADGTYRKDHHTALMVGESAAEAEGTVTSASPSSMATVTAVASHTCASSSTATAASVVRSFPCFNELTHELTMLWYCCNGAAGHSSEEEDQAATERAVALVRPPLWKPRTAASSHQEWEAHVAEWVAAEQVRGRLHSSTTPPSDAGVAAATYRAMRMLWAYAVLHEARPALPQWPGALMEVLRSTAADAAEHQTCLYLYARAVQTFTVARLASSYGDDTAKLETEVRHMRRAAAVFLRLVLRTLAALDWCAGDVLGWMCCQWMVRWFLGSGAGATAAEATRSPSPTTTTASVVQEQAAAVEGRAMQVLLQLGAAAREPVRIEAAFSSTSSPQRPLDWLRRALLLFASRNRQLPLELTVEDILEASGVLLQPETAPEVALATVASGWSEASDEEATADAAPPWPTPDTAELRESMEYALLRLAKPEELYRVVHHLAHVSPATYLERSSASTRTIRGRRLRGLQRLVVRGVLTVADLHALVCAGWASGRPHDAAPPGGFTFVCYIVDVAMKFTSTVSPATTGTMKTAEAYERLVIAALDTWGVPGSYEDGGQAQGASHARTEAADATDRRPVYPLLNTPELDGFATAEATTAVPIPFPFTLLAPLLTVYLWYHVTHRLCAALQLLPPAASEAAAGIQPEKTPGIDIADEQQHAPWLRRAKLRDGAHLQALHRGVCVLRCLTQEDATATEELFAAMRLVYSRPQRDFGHQSARQQGEHAGTAKVMNSAVAVGGDTAVAAASAVGGSWVSQYLIAWHHLLPLEAPPLCSAGALLAYQERCCHAAAPAAPHIGDVMRVLHLVYASAGSGRVLRAQVSRAMGLQQQVRKEAAAEGYAHSYAAFTRALQSWRTIAQKQHHHSTEKPSATTSTMRSGGVATGDAVAAWLVQIWANVLLCDSGAVTDVGMPCLLYALPALEQLAVEEELESSNGHSSRTPTPVPSYPQHNEPLTWGASGTSPDGAEGPRHGRAPERLCAGEVCERVRRQLRRLVDLYGVPPSASPGTSPARCGDVRFSTLAQLMALQPTASLAASTGRTTYVAAAAAVAMRHTTSYTILRRELRCYILAELRMSGYVEESAAMHAAEAGIEDTPGCTAAEAAPHLPRPPMPCWRLVTSEAQLKAFINALADAVEPLTGAFDAADGTTQRGPAAKQTTTSAVMCADASILRLLRQWIRGVAAPLYQNMEDSGKKAVLEIITDSFAREYLTAPRGEGATPSPGSTAPVSRSYLESDVHVGWRQWRKEAAARNVNGKGVVMLECLSACVAADHQQLVRMALPTPSDDEAPQQAVYAVQPTGPGAKVAGSSAADAAAVIGSTWLDVGSALRASLFSTLGASVAPRAAHQRQQQRAQTSSLVVSLSRGEARPASASAAEAPLPFPTPQPLAAPTIISGDGGSSRTLGLAVGGTDELHLLRKEEAFKRRQCSEQLLHEQKLLFASPAFQGSLLQLYVALRAEKRRKELVAFALDQHDLIFALAHREQQLRLDEAREALRRSWCEWGERQRLAVRRLLQEERDARMGVQAIGYAAWSLLLDAERQERCVRVLYEEGRAGVMALEDDARDELAVAAARAHLELTKLAAEAEEEAYWQAEEAAWARMQEEEQQETSRHQNQSLPAVQRQGSRMSSLSCASSSSSVDSPLKPSADPPTAAAAVAHPRVVRGGGARVVGEDSGPAARKHVRRGGRKERGGGAAAVVALRSPRSAVGLREAGDAVAPTPARAGATAITSVAAEQHQQQVPPHSASLAAHSTHSEDEENVVPGWGGGLAQAAVQSAISGAGGFFSTLSHWQTALRDTVAPPPPACGRGRAADRQAAVSDAPRGSTAGQLSVVAGIAKEAAPPAPVVVPDPARSRAAQADDWGWSSNSDKDISPVEVKPPESKAEENESCAATTVPLPSRSIAPLRKASASGEMSVAAARAPKERPQQDATAAAAAARRPRKKKGFAAAAVLVEPVSSASAHVAPLASSLLLPPQQSVKQLRGQQQQRHASSPDDPAAPNPVRNILSAIEAAATEMISEPKGAPSPATRPEHAPPRSQPQGFPSLRTLPLTATAALDTNEGVKVRVGIEAKPDSAAVNDREDWGWRDDDDDAETGPGARIHSVQPAVGETREPSPPPRTGGGVIATAAAAPPPSTPLSDVAKNVAKDGWSGDDDPFGSGVAVAAGGIGLSGAPSALSGSAAEPTTRFTMLADLQEMYAAEMEMRAQLVQLL